MNKHLLATFGLVALGSVFLSSGALAGSSDNSLVLGTTQQPSALEPFVNNQAISAEVIGWLYAGLVYFDQNGTLQPRCAGPCISAS